MDVMILSAGACSSSTFTLLDKIYRRLTLAFLDLCQLITYPQKIYVRALSFTCVVRTMFQYVKGDLDRALHCFSHLGIRVLQYLDSCHQSNDTHENGVR